jgi:hypothetical protein
MKCEFPQAQLALVVRPVFDQGLVEVIAVTLLDVTACIAYDACAASFLKPKIGGRVYVSCGFG